MTEREGPGADGGDGVPSPCRGLCVVDPATARCLGCKRTLGEITAWGALSDDEKRGVIAELRERP